jgi:hypothetical protein
LGREEREGKRLITEESRDTESAEKREKSKLETRMQKLEGAGNALGDFAGGFFEEFVNEGLVGLGLLGGHAAKLA